MDEVCGWLSHPASSQAELRNWRTPGALPAASTPRSRMDVGLNKQRLRWILCSFNWRSWRSWRILKTNMQKLKEGQQLGNARATFFCPSVIFTLWLSLGAQPVKHSGAQQIFGCSNGFVSSIVGPCSKPQLRGATRRRDLAPCHKNTTKPCYFSMIRQTI